MIHIERVAIEDLIYLLYQYIRDNINDSGVTIKLLFDNRFGGLYSVSYTTMYTSEVLIAQWYHGLNKKFRSDVRGVDGLEIEDPDFFEKLLLAVKEDIQLEKRIQSTTKDTIRATVKGIK